MTHVPNFCKGEKIGKKRQRTKERAKKERQKGETKGKTNKSSQETLKPADVGFFESKEHNARFDIRYIQDANFIHFTLQLCVN